MKGLGVSAPEHVPPCFYKGQSYLYVILVCSVGKHPLSEKVCQDEMFSEIFRSLDLNQFTSQIYT